MTKTDFQDLAPGDLIVVNISTGADTAENVLLLVESAPAVDPYDELLLSVRAKGTGDKYSGRSATLRSNKKFEYITSVSELSSLVSDE